MSRRGKRAGRPGWWRANGRRWLLALLVPLWLLAFLASVRAAIGRPQQAHFYVGAAAGPDRYPAVAGFRPWADESAQPVRRGDLVVRVGPHDLRGRGQFTFQRRSLEVMRDGQVAITVRRDGRELALEAPADVPRSYALLLVASLVNALVAVLILWRAPPSPTVRALTLCLMSLALSNATYFPYPLLGLVLISLTAVATFPLTLRAFLLFPEEVAARRRRRRIWWPWLFALSAPLQVSFNLALPFTPERVSAPFGLVVIAYIGAVVAILTRNYRRASAVGRRQIRILLYAAYLAAIPAMLAMVWLLRADARLDVWWFVSLFLGMVLFPLALLVAVLRHDLFDVDRLISATASYNVLAVAALALVLTVIPRLAAALAHNFAISPGAAQTGLSLGLALLVVPSQRLLRPHLERLFFPERRSVERGMSELLAALAGARTAEQLLSLTGERLDAVLRPEVCAIYCPAGAGLSTVFHRGGAVPPAIDHGSALLRELPDQPGAGVVVAVNERRWRRRLPEGDRALLAGIGAQVIVTVRRAGAHEALIVLGAKRSGDIYTAADLGLLQGLAQSLSLHFLRFDQDEIVSQARAMQAALSRYVPSAVAGELALGRDLVSGEAEVSVLFVDLRGYTSFSEGRQASEIFGTVNRYTTVVSQAVTEHGGAVVEFNGDGMMAVFGAPRPLPGKEGAAVRAGLDIVARVLALPVDRAEPLEAGVGIATGAAYVGNIRAADRDIWSAIGNTTNLAARLQALTRDLRCSVIVDQATWRGGGEPVRAFVVREGVTIRGRRRPESVYLWPPPAGAGTPSPAG